MTFVIRENWYFPLALDGARPALVAEHMRAPRGRRALSASNVEEILRGADGSVRGVRLETGDAIPVPATSWSPPIGVVPSTKLPRGHPGLALSKGGAIGGWTTPCRPALPTVGAAGDCANVTWADGSRRPEQLWYTARDQGAHGRLARCSATAAAYRRGTWYSSAKFFDLEWTTAGCGARSRSTGTITPIDAAAGVTVRGSSASPAVGSSQRSSCKGERVVGFNMLGSPLEPRGLPRLDPRAPPLDWVLGAPRRGAVRRDELSCSSFRGVLPDAGRPDEHVPAASRANRSWLAWALCPARSPRTSSCTSVRCRPWDCTSTSFKPSPSGSAGRSRCPQVLHSKWILYGVRLHAGHDRRGAPTSCGATATAPTSASARSRWWLVQVVLAFALPIVHEGLRPAASTTSRYFWPLKIEYFYPSVILQQPFLIVLW